MRPGGPAGDHFGKPGANDRIWNALEKLAVRAPDLFVRYYANDVLAVVSQAWLGPGYQITSQVNVVNPGGQAQAVHRDYHLGFQSDEVAAEYPAHVHALSPVLTLQGAVAHSDMPVESGPDPATSRTRRSTCPATSPGGCPSSARTSTRTHVQLPLAKGDAVFFNPALFHAAGTNRTADVRRMANLLQVSSAFGRAMETVDRARVAAAVYDDLVKAQLTEGWDPRESTTSSRRAPRATRSPRTSTATSRSTGSRRRPRPTSSARRSPRAGTTPTWSHGSREQVERTRTD